MPGSRRLSQRISEGDGIAIIVRVTDVESARVAEAEGAKALAIGHAIAGIREATTLPLLWTGGSSPADADAVVLRPESHADHDSIEFVVDVRDEEELELALELLDPEIFLLAARDGLDTDALSQALELLPEDDTARRSDVKRRLAIAHTAAYHAVDARLLQLEDD